MADVNDVVGVVQKLGFWGHLGKGLSGVASVLVKVALWASQHPEVVSAVENIAQAAIAAKQGDHK